MKNLQHVTLLLVISCTLSSSAWAQAQATTGVIQGTVSDQSGALVPGANVEAKNLDNNFTRSQSTDSGGRFVFLQMPVGRYTLTASKQGFSTVVQENFSLTVGQTVSLDLGIKVSAVAERIVVTATPTVDVAKTEDSTILNELTVGTTPILGRKFEDLLTLTPGVSITQGPDGDEINFAGQRGIFNNVSLDGGDYNNGFFGEQVGGQRAAIDITLEAVKEFQVVATGASAEFGRTAGGVVNVITKSGTNEVHGSLFHYQRLEALSAETSDGKPLTDFHREQFGGTLGGPLKKDKAFLFGAFEQIFENLRRDNLSVPLGTCPVSAPTLQANEALLGSNAECQRLALLSFYKSRLSQDEGQPVNHTIRNSALLLRSDFLITPKNNLGISYNFDRSRNENQTFDVATYGSSANGTEGPSKINVVNMNLFTTVTPSQLNEAHFTYSRENRPRAANKSNVPADTAMGFATTFRFGYPFFLDPTIDELFWRTDVRDKYSIIHGSHNVKMGFDWLHSNNGQVFRGFFTGRYIFDSVPGFLRYASPPGPGGFGPMTVGCSNGSYVTAPTACPAGTTTTGGPLLLYLQGAGLNGLATDATGASEITNQDLGLFIQDSWKARPNFTLNYGLRWEAQIFPDPVVPPSKTAYAKFIGKPGFPSDGTLPNQKKEFQPRIGFAWDVRNNRKSVLRANWGIYYARQNMLTQVGSITTNGVQQQTIFSDTDFIRQGFGAAPTYPGVVTPTPVPAGTFPAFTGVRVFSSDYRNPRIYSGNVAWEQELAANWSAYTDFTWSKGVHLTRFINIGNVPPFVPDLGDVFVTSSSAKSLYRGWTIGLRKRFSHGFQMEGNYVLSKDLDDDSNERDPFTDRIFDHSNFNKDYSLSDRDERHKFNFFTYAELPHGFIVNVRMQAHSAQPITPDPRVVGGRDLGRNSIRKDNAFFSLDWRALRPFKFGDKYQLIPQVEMFNSFNNTNNVNPLTTPGLFNFDGFLRQGVGDPLQVQLSLKLSF